MKMVKKISTMTIIGVLGVACCARAQDTVMTNSAPEEVTPFYRSQEISVDVFGSGSIGQQTINHITGQKIEHDGRLGAGAGVNLFLNRYVGIGGDAYTENTAHNFIDSASGSLIARLPIADTGIAPYIFGGGGYQFDEVSQAFGQFGAGIEFRFMKNAGFFVDARYVVADKTENYGVGRAGLRVNF
jgi:hypothetical protein